MATMVHLVSVSTQKNIIGAVKLLMHLELACMSSYNGDTEASLTNMQYHICNESFSIIFWVYKLYAAEHLREIFLAPLKIMCHKPL